MINKLKKLTEDPLYWSRKYFNRFYKAAFYSLNTFFYRAVVFIKRYFIQKKTSGPISIKSNDLISIIIPTLSKGKQENHLIFLKRLLSEHLPKQVYPNYEAIVYCDGPNQLVKQMVESLNDSRIKIFSSKKTLGLYGHTQTREGIKIAKGNYLVRMNDDNVPYPDYLETLLNGFDESVGVVYSRVSYCGEARKTYRSYFIERLIDIPNQLNAYIIPCDFKGEAVFGNIDCMNYMVRMDLAKKHVDSWNNDLEADWRFIEALKKNGISFKFIDKLIGDKR